MNHNSLHDARANFLRRRWFLKDCGLGLGTIAAGALLTQDAATARMSDGESPNPLAPREPHFPGKAKRVIYMFHAGAPSHLEMFDNKPERTKTD